MNKILTIILLTLTFGLPVYGQVTNNNTNPNQEKTNKVEKTRTKADKELDQRIDNLTKLVERIKEIRNVSEADKSSAIIIIQGIISNLDNLRNEIDNATSTEAVKKLRESVSKDYRVYALVMPQVNLIISADRVRTTVDVMQTIVNKLETRINNLATSSTITSTNINTAKSTLTNVESKLVSALSTIDSAVKMVAALTPDEGDKTVFESNRATIKEARAKIKSAHGDLMDAKTGVEAIIKILKKEVKKTVSTTSATSSEQ